MLTKNEQIRQTLKKTREKRKSQVCRVYTVKVNDKKLNKSQREHLKMLFVEGKRFYNHILNWSENPDNDIFRFDRKTKNVLVLNKDKVQEEKPLQYLSSSLRLSIHEQICGSIKSISKLKKKGYQKRGGRLKYKSEFNSLEFKQYGYGGTHQIKGNNRIKLQGIKKPLIVKGLNQFIHQEGIEIANLHLLNKPDGYYMAIITFIDKDKISTEKPTLEPIGIDFGCSTSFSLSNGEKINAKVEESERLKRLDRKLKKRKKGSNNYNKVKRLRAIEYQKIANKKNDLANKTVAKFKKHKLIVIQDEQLQAWQAGNHGKAVFHSILGRVKSKLKELPQIVILAKDIPTTKLCVECGNTIDINLWNRTFKCSHCGCTADRDIHAASNMLWIAEVLLNKFIRLGQTEFKRAEFLKALSNHFDNSKRTLKHEDARYSS